MRRTAVIAAVIALACVLLYVFWPRAGGTSRQNAATEGHDDAVLEQRRAARRDGDVDTSPVTVGGSVRERQGAAIAGATVSIARRNLSRGERSNPGAASEPIWATTDEQGRWQVASLPPGRYTVSATARDHTPAYVDPLILHAGESRDDIDLVLARGGNTLRGTVSDIGGGPVSGALVRATSLTQGSVFGLLRAPFTTITDEQGRYAMNLADGMFWLEVVHLDYVNAERFTEVRDGDRVEDFTLTPGAIVSGQVRRRGDDQPMPGATVTYRAGGGLGNLSFAGLGLTAVVADQQGRFELRGLSNGTVELKAFGRGFATREPTAVELGIAEHATGVIVYVDTAYTISGFVVSKQNHAEAIDGVLVGAYNFSGAVHLARESSAEDGYFEILGVQPGTYIIGAGGENRVISAMGTNVTVESRDVDDVLVELDRGVVLAGRVQPAASARISIELDLENIGLTTISPTISAAAVRAQTEEDGSFELRGVPAGKFALVANADDGSTGRLEVEVTDSDQQGLVIPLESRAYVEGTVVDSTGQPAPGLRVRAVPAKRDQRAFSIDAEIFRGRGVTREDGSFRVDGLAAGTHRISVRDEKGPLAWADEAHKDNPNAPIEVTIEGTEPVTGLRLVVEARNRTIRGIVVSGGAPVPDAWVTARFVREDRMPAMIEAGKPEADEDGAEGESNGKRRSVTVSVGSDGTDVDSDDGSEADEDKGPRRGRRGRWRPSEKPVLTDESGRFVIRGLRDATYDLEAEGLKGTHRGTLDGVRTGSDVTIALEPLAGISGRVLQKGEPVEDYLVRAEGPTMRRTHVVNDEGRYHLTRLDPGTYEISIIAEVGRASADVEVSANETAKKDFTLVAWSSVRGVVKNAVSGEPMPDLAVLAFADEGTDVGHQAMNIMTGQGPTTDDDGRFRVGRLGAGKGTLLVVDADKAGFEIVASKDFTLQSGQDLDLGELQGSTVNSVPKEERGELGMEVMAAKWGQRPRPEGADPAGEDDEPPAGIDKDAEQLWVTSVEDGGPAASVGIELGDRVVSVGGAAVAAIGPRVAQQLLSPRRLRVGQPVSLVIERDGNQNAVNVIPRAATDGESN